MNKYTEIFRKLLDKTKPVLIKIKALLFKLSYLWAILLFAFLTRMYGLGGLGASGQELENIKRIFALDNPANFLGKDASTNLYYLAQNFWGEIFGYSVFNMRFFSVLMSLIGLYVFFKFTEEWFSRKLANIATFLLSISSFHIFISRSISHEVLYPALIISALYLLTLAYRYKMWQYFLLSGILLGLGFYSSEITFVLMLVFIVSGGYFYSKNKKFLTSFIKGKAVFIGAMAVVSAPFFYSLLLNPLDFLSNFTLRPGILFDNARNLILSLVSASPRDYMFNVGTDRVFDPFILMTFLIGLIYIAMRIRRRKFYFLVVWLAILLIIIIFKNTFSLGNFVYIVPLIFIMSARIQIYVLDKWFQTFPFNKFARLIMVLGIGFLFALSATYNYKKVFLAWGKYPERKFIYNTEPVLANLADEKTYLYKTGCDKNVLGSVINIKKKDKLFELEDLNQLKKEEKVNINIITSPKSVFAVKSNVKNINLKELKGNDIILLQYK